MNWMRENKFLTAFLGAMIVGVGTLGYLLYSAYGTFSEVSEQYDRQAAELRRLQTLVPYPDEENVKKVNEQKDAFLKQIDNLKGKLAQMTVPREPLTPEQFQDKLRASVSKTEENAKKNGVKLPDKFYLGFDQYQAVPPNTAASPALGWELKAIELVVNDLINSKIDELTAITRTPLPDETGAKPQTPGASKGAEAARQAAQLVVGYPFTVGFIAEQPRLRKILNNLASTAQQFLIVRSLRIENEKDKGPSRVETGAAGAAQPPPAAVPEGAGVAAQPAAAAPHAERLQFIVGTEKLKATLNIEVVDFPQSTTANTKK